MKKAIKRVVKIEPVSKAPDIGKPMYRRVCAYCRVSTGSTDQKTSYESQKDYYTRLVLEREDWIFAGIYADQAQSGTKIKQRDGFQQMMQDCRQGRIEAIIPKELFHKVQEEKARRAAISHPSARKRNTLEKGKYSAKYVLSDIMICAECGQPYRRQVWSKYGVKRAVWRCDNRLKHGSRFCKHSHTLRETTLHEAVMAAINKVVEDQGEFVQAFRENVIRVIGSYSAKGDPTEYDAQIENLQQHVIELIEESARMGWTDEEFDREYQRIVGKIKELKKQRAKVVQECNLADSYERRTEELEGYLKKASYLRREFDDEPVRKLIQTVKVINENWIEVQFKSGIVVKQDVFCED